MNQEEADQDVADEMSEEVDSSKVMRSENITTGNFFKEERVGGRASEDWL